MEVFRTKKWQDTIFTINGSSLSPLTPKEQVIRGSNGGQIPSFVWFQCILAWESGEVSWWNTKHHLFFLLTYIWQTSFGQNYMALVAAILENISISCIFSFTKSSLWSKFYHKSFYLHFVYLEGRLWLWKWICGKNGPNQAKVRGNPRHQKSIFSPNILQ